MMCAAMSWSGRSVCGSVWLMALLAWTPIAFAQPVAPGEVAPPPEPMESGPAEVWLQPFRDVQRMLSDDLRLDLELGYTLIFQWADPTVDQTDALLSGSFDLAGVWRAMENERGAYGQLGLLVEGGQIITADADEDLSANLGSALGINDDRISDDIVVTELWWQQTLLDGKLDIAAGRLDQTVYFDANRIANDETTQFLATPLVNNPAVAFPDAGLGVNVNAQVHEQVAVRVGFGNANAVGSEADFNSFDLRELFIAAEAEWTPVLFDRPGAYRVMVWTTDSEDGPTGQGVALSFDQEVLADGLMVFARYGHGAQDVVDFDHFASAGVGLEGPLGRADDLAAIGWAWGHASNSGGDEHLVEAFYRVQVTRWLAITPDVQLVFNPIDGTDATVFVGGVRAQFTF